MLFNSLHFLLLFFPIVTIAYFLFAHRYRWQLLLIASCYFYMAFIPVYVLILLLTILVDYAAGMLIESSRGRTKKLFLILSLVANIGVLAFFKYFNFFLDNVASLFTIFGWNVTLPYLSMVLPIGLSFHTFQSLSYTIEVYRGRFKAERHFGLFALYVMFYPQLVAGPIERPQNLLSQFREKHFFEYGRVTEGLRLVAWGLFKKVVIADRLAIVVNQVYGQPREYQGIALIAATVLFAYQIYCDFSGYSDIAIGTARIMGIRLMKNFKQPYISQSISEFWSRWHISLSTWFRDYLYIPLGGNRVPKWRWQFNLAVVFLVSGLWHGANWTFLVWGALHAFYLISSIWAADAAKKVATLLGIDQLPRFPKGVKISATFALICFAWIFFRANSISDATYIVMHLFDGIDHLLLNLFNIKELRLALAGLNLSAILPALPAIAIVEFVQYKQLHGGVTRFLFNKPWRSSRWLAYYALIGYILVFGKFGTQQFIYFQF